MPLVAHQPPPADRLGMAGAEGDRQRRRGEEAGEGDVADVQAARVGAEGRQHDALAVSDETGPPYGAARAGNASAGVQMAGRLASLLKQASDQLG